MSRRWLLSIAIGLVVLAVVGVPAAQAPKRGGVLNAMLIENPPGFSIHEAATIAGVWPVAPCFSNLVVFDPLKPVDTAETVIPELAEKWSRQDNYRNLVFFLRRNVKWHDGQPFTAKDVKYTFDVVREASDAPAKLRLNPRKEWYANVEAVEAPEPHTVVFRLKRPQPSLLLMLASGYSPVYPAHVSLNDLRQRCVGAGPFKLKQYLPGTMVELERNPEYFVPGRPYLDGIRFPIITLSGKDLQMLPGYREPARDKAEARKLLTEAGFGPDRPLRGELVTRNIAIYVDLASFVADQLRQVGIEATVKQVESPQYFPALARRDYQIGANLTASGIDDPDGY